MENINYNMDNNEYPVSEVFNMDQIDAWRFAVSHVAIHYRLDFSEENLRLSTIWQSEFDKKEEEIIKKMAKHVGMVAKFINTDGLKINSWMLPVVLELAEHQIAVVKSIKLDPETNEKVISVIFYGQGNTLTDVKLKDVLPLVEKVVLFRPLVNMLDSRVDDYIKPKEKHWIWRIIFRDMKPYKHVMVASLIINILGLAGITFSMHTYDRVIPSASYPTLFVLLTGVILAFTLDFILKMLRYSVLDLLGKKADLRISDKVFGKILRIKNSHRPQSTGSFITQIRDLEQVREMVSSSTVSALADLPFFFLFLLIIYSLGGIVFIAPLCGALLMVIPGLLKQNKLKELANEAQRESTLRSGMLVEAVQGLDDIKATQSEYRFQQQWMHYTETTSSASLESKHLTHQLMTWNYFVQNSVFVAVICIGIPFAIVGELSTGALVASSILSSRMMGPISQIANLIIKWQQTQVSISSLDAIMELDVDTPEYSKKVHKSHLFGDFLLKNVSFKYRVEDALPAIYIKELNIKAGERVAILGNNGSGKTSLLNALSGTMLTDSGVISVDDINLEILDPADLRRDVGYLTQNARLFHGSIRDNLLLGNPVASEEAIVKALEMSGASNFINTIPDGMNFTIKEGGIGLSMGQKQMILISRILIRDPSIILLDEPTAPLDDGAEANFVEQIDLFSREKTLIISTHRKKILNLVDRIILMSDGQIVLDTSKTEALQELSLN